MRLANTSILSVSLLISGSIALPGAAHSAAIISYHQVGICKRYDTPAGPVTARSDEGFAIFKIEAVDNTKTSGSFDFDPTHLYVDQSTPEQKAKKAVWDKNRRFVYLDPRFAQNMSVSSAVETTIPEGAKREINGFAVVPLGINNPSGGPEANQYSFDLVYDTWSTDEHEANGPGGSFFWIFALGEVLFGGPKLGSKAIDLVKTNASETTWSVAGNCKELPFK